MKNRFASLCHLASEKNGNYQYYCTASLGLS